MLLQTEPLSTEEARRRAVYQLLSKEQQYTTCLQFGISRFLVPLSERRDLLNANEHYTLFQNAEEVLSSQQQQHTLRDLIRVAAERVAVGIKLNFTYRCSSYRTVITLSSF